MKKTLSFFERLHLGNHCRNVSHLFIKSITAGGVIILPEDSINISIKNIGKYSFTIKDFSGEHITVVRSSSFYYW